MARMPGSFSVGRVPTPKSVPTPKVPTPRNNPAGRVRPPLGFPHVSPPRIKPMATRQYNKIPTAPNPSQEGGLSSGFGATGLTGES